MPFVSFWFLIGFQRAFPVCRGIVLLLVKFTIYNIMYNISILLAKRQEHTNYI